MRTSIRRTLLDYDCGMRYSASGPTRLFSVSRDAAAIDKTTTLRILADDTFLAVTGLTRQDFCDLRDFCDDIQKEWE